MELHQQQCMFVLLLVVFLSADSGSAINGEEAVIDTESFYLILISSYGEYAMYFYEQARSGTSRSRCWRRCARWRLSSR